MRTPIRLSMTIQPEKIMEATFLTQSNFIEGGRRVIHKSSSGRTPTLTIATVTYNCRNQLAVTVNSVLALQRDDIDYIVVDGGSSDRTIDLLRGYGDRLEYWLSEPDEGIYDAMNKAVGLAVPNSYILFLGAGDEVLRVPDRRTIAVAKAAGIEMLFGDVLIGKRLFRSSFSAKLNYRNTLHHQGLFIRKGSQTEPWFNKSLRIFADWDVNLGLFVRKVRAEYLGYTVAYAEPDGVSAKLHLAEIAQMIVKRSGWMRALAAVAYHGFLYIIRLYARFSNSTRK